MEPKECIRCQCENKKLGGCMSDLTFVSLTQTLGDSAKKQFKKLVPGMLYTGSEFDRRVPAKWTGIRQKVSIKKNKGFYYFGELKQSKVEKGQVIFLKDGIVNIFKHKPGDYYKLSGDPIFRNKTPLFFIVKKQQAYYQMEVVDIWEDRGDFSGQNNGGRLVKCTLQRINRDCAVAESKNPKSIYVYRKGFENKIGNLRGNEDGDQYFIAVRKNRKLDITDKIHFKIGKATPVSISELNKVLQSVKKQVLEQRITKMKISGHVSLEKKVDAAFNKRLSVARAKYVAQKLSKEITHLNICFCGCGSKVPVASNETEMGREKNRRIEFHVIE